MFNLRAKIERFCYKHPNFGINNLMKYVAIANVAFWLMNVVNHSFLSYIVFDPALILQGRINPRCHPDWFAPLGKPTRLRCKGRNPGRSSRPAPGWKAKGAAALHRPAAL